MLFLSRKGKHCSQDLTIDYLGREAVKEELTKYNKLLKKAKTFCKGKVFFPYSSSGKKQIESMKDCYWNDNGCGIKCMDTFVTSEIYNQITGEHLKFSKPAPRINSKTILRIKTEDDN